MNTKVTLAYTLLTVCCVATFAFALATPSISGITPNPASVGTVVTISGTGFGESQGSNTVTFNGLGAEVTSWSDTSITATVPDGAVSGNVVVTVDDVSSNAGILVVCSRSRKFQHQ